MLLLKPLDQMQLRADRPRRAGRRRLHLLDDEARRAREVGLVNHFHRALRMHEHLHARQVRPHGIDMLRPEHRMHAAVTLPEDHTALLDLPGIVAA